MPAEYQTICKLPLEDGARCGHVIASNKKGAIELPALGSAPSDRAKNLVQAIIGHMMKKHPAQLAATMMNLAEQFIGYQALTFTECQEPGVPAFLNQFAAHLASISIVPVSDESLETIIGRMNFTQEDPRRAEVLAGMKYLRDFMSRRGVTG